jgi:hypothetical protein
MDEMDRCSYAIVECEAEFDCLFPNGFAGADVLQEIAAAGWENSELLAIFHPSAEQVYQESLRFHRNIQSLSKKATKDPSPEPTREEIKESFSATPVDCEREVRELVGMCLWDIFSDNHEVIDSQGRVIDIGSFRAAGDFIADVINRQIGERRYDYMDFYMGTIWVAQRADLTPVYKMIFRRLKSRQLDWIYHFPRLFLCDLRHLRDEIEGEKEPDWLNYSPSEALAKEEADKEHQKQVAETRERLEEDFRQQVDEAREDPPPRIVEAYRKVFDRFPAGWPPSYE